MNRENTEKEKENIRKKEKCGPKLMKEKRLGRFLGYPFFDIEN